MKQTLLVAFICLLAREFVAGASSPVPEATPSAGPARTLSLAEARRLAFQRNWDLLAARSDVDLAVAQRIVAREFPNPTLSLSTTKISADGRANATSLGNGVLDRSYDTVAAVNQLFEVGGKRASRKASAAATFRGGDARLADARRVLELGVTQAYVAALLAQANAAILTESAESLRKEAGIAEARLRAGDIARTDKSQIEISAQRLELDASAASNAVTTAKIAVEVLLAESQPSGNWVPGDTLETLVQSTENLPENLLGKELAAQRPDLVAADADLRKAEADLRLQRALRIPDPTLFLQYEHEPPDLPNTVGIGVSLPLPLWNRNQGAIQAALATRQKAEVALQKRRGEVAAEVATARNNYTSARTRFQQAQQEILPKSAEVRQTISLAYEKGSASLLDLLSAQRNDNDVRLAVAQAAAETARALAELKAALNITSTTPKP
jgi:cobalt-zinc-cadmium efflux system outer membrane protein